MLSAQHLPGGGLWVDAPWRVMAFGFLYFSATGIWELREHRWLAEDAPARQSMAA